MADTTTQAAPTIAERVARGVAWLDTNDPGWWKVDQPGHGPDSGPIDLDNLTMRHCHYCVGGYRWGSYYLMPISLDKAVACGFDVSDAAIWDAEVGDLRSADAEFEALGVEWTRVITERREAAAREGTQP